MKEAGSGAVAEDPRPFQNRRRHECRASSRAKLSVAGSRVKTAEDFIHYCGSASSISRKPYEIRFPDGRTIPSADFLRQKLVDFDRASGRR